MPENKELPSNNLAAEFRRLVPTLVITALIAFATSWWNTQNAQNDTRYRLETVEQKAKTNAENIAQNSAAIQQNAIHMAEMSKDQQFISQQLQEIKREQEEIKRSLRR